MGNLESDEADDVARNNEIWDPHVPDDLGEALHEADRQTFDFLDLDEAMRGQGREGSQFGDEVFDEITIESDDDPLGTPASDLVFGPTLPADHPAKTTPAAFDEVVDLTKPATDITENLATKQQVSDSELRRMIRQTVQKGLHTERVVAGADGSREVTRAGEDRQMIELLVELTSLQRAAEDLKLMLENEAAIHNVVLSDDFYARLAELFRFQIQKQGDGADFKSYDDILREKERHMRGLKGLVIEEILLSKVHPDDEHSPIYIESASHRPHMFSLVGSVGRIEQFRDVSNDLLGNYVPDQYPRLRDEAMSALLASETHGSNAAVARSLVATRERLHIDDIIPDRSELPTSSGPRKNEVTTGDW